MPARGQRKLPYHVDNKGKIKQESSEDTDDSDSTDENLPRAPVGDGDALGKAITLASEQTMGALEVREALTKIQRHLIARLPRIVAKLVEKAEDGDLMAIKLILDRFIPTRKAVERIEGESMASGGIRIIVQGTTTINNDVVTEAEYEEG